MSGKNIFQRISAVMQDVQYLAKDDQIEFGKTKYRAISEEKVTTTIRKSLIAHGIVIVPVKQEHSKDGVLTTVDVTYRIQNIENENDYIEAVSSGTGVDTQDKGVGKAMTYAYKYLLLRTFAIPTGEDPDKISSAELDDRFSREQKIEYIDDIKKKVLLDSLEIVGSDIESTLKYLQKKYPDTAPHSIDEITLEQFTPYIKALEKKKEAMEKEAQK
ncbi:MAG: ERF family protein [Acutalibacteraceae bacterium]